MLAILLIIISEVKRKTEKKKKKKATERLASYPRIRKRVLYKSMLWLVFKKASVIFVVHTCSVLYLQCIILGQIVKSQWCLKLAYNIFFMLRLYYYRFPCFMIKQKLELAALCLSVFEYLTGLVCRHVLCTRPNIITIYARKPGSKTFFWKTWIRFSPGSSHAAVSYKSRPLEWDLEHWSKKRKGTTSMWLFDGEELKGVTHLDYI